MKIFHIGSITLGVVLLCFLIWSIGLDALWHNLCTLGWGLVPFILLEGVVDLFHTAGWRYCLSPPHRSLPFFRLFAIRLAGSSINYFTPTADLGGEVIKGALLSLNHRGPEAATGVIIGKLAYVLSQLLFVVVGSVLVLWRIRLSLVGSVAMLIGSALLGAGIVGFLIVQKYGKLGAVVRWFVRHHVGGETLREACRHINMVDEGLASFYAERPWNLPSSMLWHAAGLTCSIAGTWYFLFLLGTGSFITAAGIWFLGTWFDLLTFAIPLGIGVQEGGRVVAFKALGLGLAAGLTYGVAIRLEQIFWAGVGLLVYAMLLKDKKGEEVLAGKQIERADPARD